MEVISQPEKLIVHLIAVTDKVPGHGTAGMYFPHTGKFGKRYVRHIWSMVIPDYTPSSGVSHRFVCNRTITKTAKTHLDLCDDAVRCITKASVTKK